MAPEINARSETKASDDRKSAGVVARGPAGRNGGDREQARRQGLRWVVLRVYKGVASRKAREKEKEIEREDASNNYVRARAS